MTPEQIMHHSNGIWTCSGCGDIVDRLECEYSPAQLAEMKSVRETAERMAASDPQIRGISCYISPFEFDEVFWENLPNFEDDKIRPALLDIAARKLQRLYERSNRDMSVPDHLPLKPLASAIKTIIKGDGDDPAAFLNRAAAHPYPHSRPAGVNHTAALRKAAEIVGSWAACIPSHFWSGTGWHIHHVNVLIAACHPQTRVVCESPIRVVGTGCGRHDHTADRGEILHLKVMGTGSLVNNLNWQLGIAFVKGKMLTTSTLRLAGRLWPRDFHSAQWEEEFDSYEQVVRKLAEGWQPIGFVDMNSGQSALNDRMHPEAFEIELQITPSELEECLYRCSKIRRARALQRQWGWSFEFTDAYFKRELDLTMIQAASDELRTRLGPPPYWHRGESPPLVRVGERNIKFLARNGVIAFYSEWAQQF
ncbi:MAG: hypothetical protein I8H91_02725 [Burkholderiales bacterium]|nr:hypothetical protein [Burkholderiales bacterium]